MNLTKEQMELILSKLKENVFLELMYNEWNEEYCDVWQKDGYPEEALLSNEGDAELLRALKDWLGEK